MTRRERQRANRARGHGGKAAAKVEGSQPDLVASYRCFFHDLPTEPTTATVVREAQVPSVTAPVAMSAATAKLSVAATAFTPGGASSVTSVSSRPPLKVRVPGPQDSPSEFPPLPNQPPAMASEEAAPAKAWAGKSHDKDQKVPREMVAKAPPSPGPHSAPAPASGPEAAAPASPALTQSASAPPAPFNDFTLPPSQKAISPKKALPRKRAESDPIPPQLAAFLMSPGQRSPQPWGDGAGRNPWCKPKEINPDHGFKVAILPLPGEPPPGPLWMLPLSFPRSLLPSLPPCLPASPSHLARSTPM
jgi:hypothetical protein